MKILRLGAVALVCCLYLSGLGTMGLFGPDETRYAYIGRAMAQTGDWVMPRLYGVPWFEKPALLYWLIGLGNAAGFGPEWAPRLPIALLGAGFLAFFWYRVRALWGETIAGYATAILGTSAGWLAYSHAAVTDIPLSVFFGAAMLFGLEWLESEPQSDRLPALAAVCLGFAVLAKGVVAPALFLPIFLIGWRRAVAWFRPVPLFLFAFIVLPWYTLCQMQSNGEFLRVFLGEHTLGRVTSSHLQHVQKWWYYLPVTVLLLFPWFPLLPLIRLRSKKTAALLAIVVFGIVSFSISINKLPGYVLPLLPALSILLGEAFSNARHWKIPLVATASLCGLLPLAAAILPIALSRGLRAAEVPWAQAGWVAVALIAGVALVRLPRQKAFCGIAAVVAVVFVVVEVRTFPAIDQAASARPIWLATHPNCYGNVNRSIAYGLQYYAGRPLPECTVLDRGNPRVVR